MTYLNQKAFITMKILFICEEYRRVNGGIGTMVKTLAGTGSPGIIVYT